MLHLGHSIPWAGYLGKEKSERIIVNRFYWPGFHADRNTKARQVANCLVQLFSRVGIPKEVLTDQATNFTSKSLKQVYSLLGIQGIKTTPYHPQTDGLVERFNQTLKSMLRKFVSDSGADWDQWLPYLLFSYRDRKCQTDDARGSSNM